MFIGLPEIQEQEEETKTRDTISLDGIGDLSPIVWSRGISMVTIDRVQCLGDVVVGLPYVIETKELIFTYQYRAGLQDPCYEEFVAGSIDKGETPEDALVREMFEECGVIPRKRTKLGSYFLDPCTSRRLVHIYACEIAEPPDISNVYGDIEAGEVIKIRVRGIDDCIKNVKPRDTLMALAFELFKQHIS